MIEAYNTFAPKSIFTDSNKRQVHTTASNLALVSNLYDVNYIYYFILNFSCKYNKLVHGKNYTKTMSTSFMT